MQEQLLEQFCNPKAWWVDQIPSMTLQKVFRYSVEVKVDVRDALRDDQLEKSIQAFNPAYVIQNLRQQVENLELERERSVSALLPAVRALNQLGLVRMDQKVSLDKQIEALVSRLLALQLS